GSKLAIDSAGNIYVAGTTGGSFPTTAHAAVPATADAGGFIAKFSPDGSRLIYSTYLPNSSGVSALAVDAGGNAYLSGSTGGYAYHAFVVKLNPDGSAFLYNTLLAGSGQDFATAPAIPAWGASPGGFVAKLTPDAHALAYSTYLMIYPNSGGVRLLALNSAGEVYIAATVGGAGFPVTPNAPQPCFGGYRDILVAHLNAAGSLLEATYLGTRSEEHTSELQS